MKQEITCKQFKNAYKYLATSPINIKDIIPNVQHNASKTI